MEFRGLGSLWGWLLVFEDGGELLEFLLKDTLGGLRDNTPILSILFFFLTYGTWIKNSGLGAVMEAVCNYH